EATESSSSTAVSSNRRDQPVVDQTDEGILGLDLERLALGDPEAGRLASVKGIFGYHGVLDDLHYELAWFRQQSRLWRRRGCPDRGGGHPRGPRFPPAYRERTGGRNAAP